MEKMIKYGVIMLSTYLAILRPSYTIFGVLIIINICDYLTGITSAISRKEKITIEKAFNGMVVKFNKLFYVMVALTADILINHNFTPEKAIAPTSAAVITWLIINEMVSIISNISNNEKLNIPPALLNFLENFKGE